MKYIDADKLIAEVERLKEETPIGICEYDKGEENGRYEVLNHLLSTIASLQQEQPKDKQIVSIEGWAARDKNGHLNFFLGKPHRIKNTRGEEYWVGHARMKQPNEFFPELSWNDEPIEVELLINKI